MCLLLYNEKVRSLYYENFNSLPLLSNIDLIYAVHGLVLNFITISQLYLWGFERRTTNKIKNGTKLIIVSIFIILSMLVFNYLNNKITILTITLFLSYLKILMSLIKYLPQLNHNYQRKSVFGFSVFTIVLDLTGGIFSILQLFIDAYLTTNSLINFKILKTNSNKLGLSFVTLFFDLCFIYQWWIYKDNSSKALLSDKDDV